MSSNDDQENTHGFSYNNNHTENYDTIYPLSHSKSNRIATNNQSFGPKNSSSKKRGRVSKQNFERRNEENPSKKELKTPQSNSSMRVKKGHMV